MVDRVNEDLRRALRGPHLQIGHSYFMRSGLDADETTLRRIWDYDVYPFSDDQLSAREHELAQFRWENVRARYGQYDLMRPCPGPPRRRSPRHEHDRAAPDPRARPLGAGSAVP